MTDDKQITNANDTDNESQIDSRTYPVQTENDLSRPINVFANQFPTNQMERRASTDTNDKTPVAQKDINYIRGIYEN